MMLTTASLPQHDVSAANTPPLTLARPGVVVHAVSFQNKLSNHSRAVTVTNATERAEVPALESWAGGALADSDVAGTEYDGSALFTFTQSNKHVVGTAVDMGGPGTFIGATATAAAAASVSAALPAGWAPGDIAVAVFGGNESLTWAAALPAGWDLIADAQDTGSLAVAQRVFARQLEAGDVSVSYGLTAAGNLSLSVGVWRMDPDPGPPPGALTATPDPARALVMLDTTGLPEPVVVTRTAAGGPAVPVRDAQPVPPGVTAVDDRECPFGIPVVYQATDGTGAVSSVSTRLDYPSPRLTSAGVAALGADLRIVSDAPPSWDVPSSVQYVIGRPDPIVTAQPMRTRAGALTVVVDSLAESDALRAILADGMPALLRTPCGSLIRDAWIAVSRVDEDAPDPRNPVRRVTLTYTETGRPPGGSAGRLPWTWADVLTEHGTWAEVLAAYDTWADVLSGPPT